MTVTLRLNLNSTRPHLKFRMPLLEGRACPTWQPDMCPLHVDETVEPQLTRIPLEIPHALPQGETLPNLTNLTWAG